MNFRPTGLLIGLVFSSSLILASADEKRLEPPASASAELNASTVKNPKAMGVALDLPTEDAFAKKLREYFTPLDKTFIQVFDSTNPQDIPDLIVRRGAWAGFLRGAQGRGLIDIGSKGVIEIGSKGPIEVGDKGDAQQEVVTQGVAQQDPDKREGYVALADGVPIFNLFIEANGNPLELAAAIENYAAQRNLLALHNPGSILQNAIEVRVVIVRGTRNPGGAFVPLAQNAETVLPPQAEYSLDQGQRFKLQFHNTSSQDIYVAVAELAPDGGINFLVDAQDSKQLFLKPGATKVTDRYTTSPPAGVSHFKIFITTQPTDFSYLERAATRRGFAEPDGPFDILFAAAVGIKRSKRDKPPAPDQWAVLNINFQVSEQTIDRPAGK